MKSYCSYRSSLAAPYGKFLHPVVLLIVLLAFLAASSSASAQGILCKVTGTCSQNTTQIPAAPFQAVTTSIKDAYPIASWLDSYSQAVQPQPTSSLDVFPGYYQITVRSYCLHAGAYAPTKGSAYLFSPLKGSQTTLITSILEKSEQHPEVAQEDIQTLLWGIEAGVKYSDYPTTFQVHVAPLLTPEEIASMEVEGFLGSELSSLTNLLPGDVTQIASYFEQFRTMLTDPSSSYAQLEQYAVKNGVAPKGKDIKDYSVGQWAYARDGFYVREVDHASYQNTMLEVLRPGPYALTRDSQGRIQTLRSGNLILQITYLTPSGTTSNGSTSTPHIDSVMLLSSTAPAASSPNKYQLQATPWASSDTAALSQLVQYGTAVGHAIDQSSQFASDFTDIASFLAGLSPTTTIIDATGGNYGPGLVTATALNAWTYSGCSLLGQCASLSTATTSSIPSTALRFASLKVSPRNWEPIPQAGGDPLSPPSSCLELAGFVATPANPSEQRLAQSGNCTPSSSSSNDNTDDQCQQDGGSSIGCQNQSLGEDVPVVGTGFFLHYEGDRVPGRSNKNSVASADAAMFGGWTLNVHHVYDPANKILFQGDGRQRSAWQLGTPVTYNGNTLLTSIDGREIYVFDPSGRHLQTLKPLTGALRYQFGYDPAGNLTSVTDGSGNVTTIQRDTSEHPLTIVSPWSQSTNIHVDANGFLSQIIDPANNAQAFANTPGGLISSRTDANGNAFTYMYDSNGRLVRDSSPPNSYTALSRVDSALGYAVTTVTAMGRQSTYQVNTQNTGERFTDIWPNGLQATDTKTPQNGQLSEIENLPSGSTDNSIFGPDPRLGLAEPILKSETSTRGNLTMNIVGNRAVVLSGDGDPYSVSTQTDTKVVNGRSYASVFTGANRTMVSASPAGRTATTILDSLERISSAQLGKLAPNVFSYDSHGRISTVTQGARLITFAYDSNGFLASLTDPMQLTTTFVHDAAGRLTSTTLPDGRVIKYGYDSNGNHTSVTPPNGSVNTFSFTAANLVSTYTPPAVTGTGPTAYAYDADRDLTTITRPDGSSIAYAFDNGGRLTGITIPTEVIAFTFDPNTGNLSDAAVTGGESIAYAYNGPLLSSSTWTGTVAGSVSRTYDNNLWIASESVNAASAINFTYDSDGLLTNAGPLALTLDPTDGLITATALGSTNDTRAYDTFGELTGYTANYQASALYNVTFTRDADGRITSKTETIGGKTNSFTYAYDPAGRLITVTENGTPLSSYVYDSNSNRLAATTSAGTVTGTYDAQDRLLTYGNATYTYTANGELASQTAGGQVTTYQYGALGNLLAVILPNGVKVTYIVDAESHRVGKQVNGVVQAGFLYDRSRVVAQLNASNAIVSQFIYASSNTVPDYMVNGGVTYRIFSDQLGSPRVVVNIATGAVTEQIDYDEFGNVINDTNPGFQPFGFAGGVYDQDTKLLRFGARDYSAAFGRWTAKDPIFFAAGVETNLYGYVLEDPINSKDGEGLFGQVVTSTLTNWLIEGWGAFSDFTYPLWSTISNYGGSTPPQDCSCQQNTDGEAGEVGEGISGPGAAGSFYTDLGVDAAGSAAESETVGPALNF